MQVAVEVSLEQLSLQLLAISRYSGLKSTWAENVVSLCVCCNPSFSLLRVPLSACDAQLLAAALRHANTRVKVDTANPNGNVIVEA